jgi:hypothetical protein
LTTQGIPNRKLIDRLICGMFAEALCGLSSFGVNEMTAH